MYNKNSREKRNAWLLSVYLRDYSFRLFWWSFMDGAARRIGAHKTYVHTSRKRRQVCQNYLRKNYSDIINKWKYKRDCEENYIGIDSPVWIFWWQGKRQCPYPVDLCVQSVERRSGRHPVHFVSQENIDDYIDIPKYIRKKFDSGNILPAHFADYIRMCLLYKYGGIWIDAAFMLTRPIPESISDYKFFSINHGGKRDWVASSDKWSIGLLGSGKNYTLMGFCKEMFEAYWEKENVEIAYLFSDYIIALGYEEIEEIHQDVDALPENNKDCFFFIENGNKECDSAKLKRILSENWLAQLTYKVKWEKVKDGKETYFGVLLKALESVEYK